MKQYLTQPNQEIVVNTQYHGAFENEWGSGRCESYEYEGLRAFVLQYDCIKTIQMKFDETSTDGVSLSCLVSKPFVHRPTWQEVNFQLDAHDHSFVISTEPNFRAKLRSKYSHTYVLIRIEESFVRRKLDELAIVHKPEDIDLYVAFLESGKLKSQHLFFFKEFYKRLQTLSDELRRIYIYKALVELTLEWILEANQDTDTPEVSADAQRVLQIKNYIADHLYKAIPTIRELARYSGMSPTRFKTVFKDTFGESVHRHLLRMRLERAKELLESAHQPSQVSYMVGFSHLSAFSRAYKAFYGISPAYYVRKRKHTASTKAFSD